MPKVVPETPVAYDENALTTIPLLESGVDWLTVTCTDKDNREAMAQFAAALIHLEAESGNHASPMNLLGFEGLKCGGVAFGHGSEMSMMRLSSYMAYTWWHKAYELATNCSRIDLQVTVGPVLNPREMILLHGKQARAYVANWLRPPHIDIRDSNVDEPTVYFNKRVSDLFGRIYDKGYESKLRRYQSCVRFEAQFNGKCAKLMASKLASEKSGPPGCAGRVHQFFSKRGCRLAWLSEDTCRWSAPRRRSDAVKRLRWLSKQVRPCIRSLIEAGYERDVIIALGLMEGAQLDHENDNDIKED